MQSSGEVNEATGCRSLKVFGEVEAGKIIITEWECGGWAGGGALAK